MTSEPIRQRPPGNSGQNCGLVVLLTGLPGSGKTTLAKRLHDLLLERTDRTVSLLDGDLIRPVVSAELGYSRQDRETHTRRIGYVAAEIARHKGTAICSVVTPYTESRDDFRRMVEHAARNVRPRPRLDTTPRV